MTDEFLLNDINFVRVTKGGVDEDVVNPFLQHRLKSWQRTKLVLEEALFLAEP